jgi:FAD-dependent oxidoreductase domain-containing protein 1
MSLYGADFLRNIKQHLGDDVDVNFVPHGYLMMASEEGAETLERNSRLQVELGARNELLSAKKLKEKFPWLNVDGIALGCHGLEKEGWFDPWALLCALKRKAIQYGAHYVKGEVVGFDFKSHPDILMQGVESGQYQGLENVIVKMPDGQHREIKFSLCVLAAGAQSGNIAKLAHIGTGSGLLHFPLPVEPRKRFVYVFSTQDGNAPGLNTPLTIDPTGTYFRRDGLGGNYIGGRSPSFENEPICDNLDVDFNYFDTDVWPNLAQRVPAFSGVKVHNAWAGYYEYNTFDENGIIGTHPYYGNMIIATGFSGHGNDFLVLLFFSGFILNFRFRHPTSTCGRTRHFRGHHSWWLRYNRFITSWIRSYYC